MDALGPGRSRLGGGLPKVQGPGEAPRSPAVPVAKLAHPETAPLGHGLAHAKDAASGAAFTDSVLAARSKYQRELLGEVPVDAASYAALTGISVDAAEAARLDARVKAVAERMGLEGQVGFATETKFLGRFFEYAFLGTFQAFDRRNERLLVGIGVKARTFEDVDLLYKYEGFGGGVPAHVRPMVEDFLKLSEDERIESILVHEHAEREAAADGSSNPHRTAVREAPYTEYTIAPRTRRHLELYARLDEGGR